MPKYQVVPAAVVDVTILAEQMAEEDVREVLAQGWPTPLAAVLGSLEGSYQPLAWLAPDGTPLCVYGVVPLRLLPPAGQPWMLAHRDLPRHARAFLRESRRWLQGEQARYEYLVNWVGAWHTRSIRWLSWLGFTIHPAQAVLGCTDTWHRVEWKRG